MNNKVSDKINRIKEEHQQLLDIAKTQILENNGALQDDTDNMMDLLAYDENNVKRYESIKQAHELIVSLTEQILSAQSVDEIVALRKKINYYINKIKAELKRRNVSEEYQNSYLDKVTSLRKSIALYIRFFKRGDNICKIDQLSNNFDNLSKEDLMEFKKCLQKEDRYNKRNINAFNQTQEEVKPAKAAEDPDVQEAEAEVLTGSEAPSDIEGEAIDTTIFPISLQPDGEDTLGFDDKDGIFSPLFNQHSNTPESETYDIKYITQDTPYDETLDFFCDKITNYNNIFGVVEPIDYTKGNFGKNSVTFWRNIPRYMHNKLAIRNMERQFDCFYRGVDLAAYIEFMKKKNSIYEALKTIFSRTYLFSSEDTILAEHEECAKWLHDFCANQELPVWVRRRQTTAE